MAFKETVHIHATVETVFDIAADFDHAPKIMETVVKTEKLTEGPVQIGTQVRETRNIRGKEVSTVLTVSEFSPNQSYAVISESAGMTVTYHYEFQAEEDETIINFTGSIQSKGLKNALIRPLFEKILKKEDKDHLLKLKEYIEKQIVTDH